MQEVVDQPKESSSKSQITAKDNSSFGIMFFNPGNSSLGSLGDEAGDKRPSKVGLTSSTSMIGRTQVSAHIAVQVNRSEQNQKQSLASSSATPMLQTCANAKTLQKKLSVGQKKKPSSSPPTSRWREVQTGVDAEDKEGNRSKNLKVLTKNNF